MSEAADEILDLDLLRRGDERAFARLVERYQAVVLGLGQSLGLAGFDLEDAAAEVFAAVYRALPGFEGRSELGTWVYRLAVRTILKVRARHRRHAGATVPQDLPDVAQPAPQQVASEREINRMLWRAVEALEPRQAIVVELYYRRQWPLERIAAAMGCPEGTVKVLLFRARQRLRAVLEEKEFRP